MQRVIFARFVCEGLRSISFADKVLYGKVLLEQYCQYKNSKNTGISMKQLYGLALSEIWKTVMSSPQKIKRLSTMETWRVVIGHAIQKEQVAGLTTPATFSTTCWALLWSVRDGGLGVGERRHALQHLAEIAKWAIDAGVVSRQQLHLANPMDLTLPDDLVEWLQVWDEYSEGMVGPLEVPEA